ncbi:MAG: hypothetical protein ACLSAH_08150 [Bilophila wadsworthia]
MDDYGGKRHGICPYGSRPVIDDEQVMDVIRDRDAKLAQTGGQVPIEEFEYKVRRLINDYVRPPKNEYKLDRALWWMDRFRSELRTEVCIRISMICLRHMKWKTSSNVRP